MHYTRNLPTGDPRDSLQRGVEVASRPAAVVTLRRYEEHSRRRTAAETPPVVRAKNLRGGDCIVRSSYVPAYGRGIYMVRQKM